MTLDSQDSPFFSCLTNTKQVLSLLMGIYLNITSYWKFQCKFLPVFVVNFLDFIQSSRVAQCIRRSRISPALQCIRGTVICMGAMTNCSSSLFLLALHCWSKVDDTARPNQVHSTTLSPCAANHLKNKQFCVNPRICYCILMQQTTPVLRFVFFHSKICLPPLFLPNLISPATPLFHAGLLAGWRAWKKRIYWGPAWLHPRGGGRMQVKTGIFNDHIQTFSGIFNDQIQTFSQVWSDLCQVLGWSCAL